MSEKIYQPYQLGRIQLQNRLVMAPLTRSRAIGNNPNQIMAEYYGQRASAGLIISEGTSPSPNGLGYARIPGAYSQAQVNGWKKVTKAVHDRGGKIFLQIMHTGRVSHPANMPTGSQLLAPSAVRLADAEMWTDDQGMQPYPSPKAMTAEELQTTKQEYITTAKNAIAAGFDGVELHAANGYLLEQFLSPLTNQRTDGYGGSIENRLRFVLEVAKETVEAIGADRVGMRISPYGAFNGMGAFDEVDEEYRLLAQKLTELGLVYLHLVDHSSMGAPEVPGRIKKILRENFGNTFILSGGYDVERAEADLQADRGDLVAIGRLWLANPDLIERHQAGVALNEPDATKFYTPGPEGYTDYPTMAEVEA